MPASVDPATQMELFELSHAWGHGVPMQPGYDDVKIFRSSQHARNGVMAHRVRMVMHSGTHLNAPRHLIATAQGVGEIELDRLFGSGVVLSIPKGEWQLIEVADLESASPAIEAGDLVVICTGWHKKYSDSPEYYGHGPGLSKAAAEWLVHKQIGLLAMDTPQIDHPMATSLAQHRNGPLMKRLPEEYREKTGRDPLRDFPEWNVAHRTLLAAGIPTVENAGGDLAEMTPQRCTIHACPWNWLEGDACPIRLVAFRDPTGQYRLEAGAGA